MSGLVLKLGPKERVLVNGAVIENGDRRSRLAILTPNAHILRLRDAIRPGEANTPVRRVCYIAQLVLSGDAPEAEARLQLLQGIEQLSRALLDDESRRLLDEATEAVRGGDAYRALKRLRALLPREDRLLAAAHSGPAGLPARPPAAALVGAPASASAPIPAPARATLGLRPPPSAGAAP
jgi:flagellar protein FlbT